MALVLGTNSGFVTTAPTADPGGTNTQIDTRASVVKDTSPSTATRITEVGWWCDTATEEANFEVGLYAADGAVVPGEAGTLLYSSTTNAKGTTAGWKRVTGLNWEIDASTDYWLGIQLDDTATATNENYTGTGGQGADTLSSPSTLPNPYGGGTWFAGDIEGTYAVWEAGAAGGGVPEKATNIRQSFIID